MKIKSQFNRCLALAFGVGTMMFVACGDDGTSVKDKETSTPIAGEVETKGDLPNCNSKREGNRYYVEDEDADYLCENNKWKNLNAADDDDDEKSSSSTKKSSSSKKDDSGDSAKSSSSVKENSSDNGKNSGENSSSAKQSSSSAKSSSSVKQSSSAASELLTCGDAGTYDPSVRFCYKESLVVNRCGRKTYEPGEEICKDGKPVTLTKGTFLDSRNGVTYKTVTIGKQT